MLPALRTVLIPTWPVACELSVARICQVSGSVFPSCQIFAFSESPCAQKRTHTYAPAECVQSVFQVPSTVSEPARRLRRVSVMPLEVSKATRASYRLSASANRWSTPQYWLDPVDSAAVVSDATMSARSVLPGMSEARVTEVAEWTCRPYVDTTS